MYETVEWLIQLYLSGRPVEVEYESLDYVAFQKYDLIKLCYFTISFYNGVIISKFYVCCANFTKKKKSPQSTHLKSFLLWHKVNFTVVITQERNAQDNVLRF